MTGQRKGEMEQSLSYEKIMAANFSELRQEQSQKPPNSKQVNLKEKHGPMKLWVTKKLRIGFLSRREKIDYT